MPVFMIRNKDGLFSSGGSSPSWSKKGKTWTSRLSLSAHFAMYRDGELGKQYVDCELVEYELQPTKIVDMNEFAKRKDFYYRLNEKHRGLDMGHLAEHLWESSLIEEYRYIVGIWGFGTNGAADLLKRLGIKKTQYRSRGSSLAFSAPEDAALFRLTYSGQTECYDLVEMIPMSNDKQITRAG